MKIRFRRRRLAAATALLFASAAQTATAQLSGAPVDTDTGIPVTYVGSRGRIGLGVDDDGHVLGELFGIAGNNGERAFLGEAYFAGAGAGGFKGGYHWLWAGGTRVDSIERPQSVTVAKIFGAWDQNRFHDRKATVGLGFEREGGELGIYYSRALTGVRLLGASIDTTVAIRTGEEGGRPFQQPILTDVLTEHWSTPTSMVLASASRASWSSHCCACAQDWITSAARLCWGATTPARPA